MYGQMMYHRANSFRGPSDVVGRKMCRLFFLGGGGDLEKYVLSLNDDICLKKINR